jgi:hypothetical protein
MMKMGLLRIIEAGRLLLGICHLRIGKRNGTTPMTEISAGRSGWKMEFLALCP